MSLGGGGAGGGGEVVLAVDGGGGGEVVLPVDGGEVVLPVDGGVDGEVVLPVDGGGEGGGGTEGGGSIKVTDANTHVAAVRVPAVQELVPETVYPESHVGWHVDPLAREPVQSPTAPFVGAVDASQNALNTRKWPALLPLPSLW